MRDFAVPGRWGLAPAVLVAAATLGGCSALNTKTPPPCPPVFILSDASHVTKYRPGAGRDLTDVVLEAEIVGFKGECGYDAQGAEVDLQVSFEVKRGPAATGRDAEISYFVAIPKFYPADEAKAVFVAPVRFPEGLDTARVNDEAISMKIPVKDRDVINQYEIFLGIQTTSDELEFNRRMKRR